VLTLDAPIDRPSAWTGDDLTGGPPRATMPAGERAALLERTAQLTADGTSVADATPAMFDDLPLDGTLDAIATELDDGRGLLVLDGLPVDDDGLAFWGLGTRLGRPLPQNKRGDRLYLVRDETKLGYEGVRGSKSAGALIFHTDAASGYANSLPDTFGLLAVRTARRGGASLALSGHTLYNRLLDERPDVIDTLRQPFCWDRSEEAGPGDDPIFRAPILEGHGADVAVRCNDAWLRRGHHLAGEALTDDQRDALQALHGVLADPSLVVRFELRPGEALLVNNLVVLHNREAFEDDDGPGRLLYRLWLHRKTR
jgi:hypothetical protein